MPRDLDGSNQGPLLIIANPRAGNGRGRRRADLLRKELDRSGLPWTISFTEHKGHAEQLAVDATGPIVVVGGDGTVHEVVNGLVPREGRLGPLAVLPGGSGDDFAANAQFPADPRALVARLRAATLRAVDVGAADIDCERGRLHRRFVNNLGFGFDAEVAIAAARTRWLRGRWLYLAATFKALRRQRIVDCALHFDGVDASIDERRPLLFASCCNGARVGGGLGFSPDARIDDGLFDVLAVTSTSRTRTLALLLRLLRRRHLLDPRVRLVRCSAATIVPSSPVACAMDGEGVTTQASALRIGVAAERLLLF
ncbi:MAG TPA: diacylglycerol kinase family protein [Planctomycetota bacterium]|nr:diacylglycerol kinase family protein [Planctomycetota bacterium]